MEEEFEKWYKSQDKAFHQGHYDVKDIAYAEWLKGQEMGQVDAIVMQRCLKCGNEPYSDKCPVLIMWDYDLGWIVEAVEDGEYEVQNLPYPLYTKNEEPDFELAVKIAKEKGVRVRYYHKWNKVAQQ